MKKRYLTKSRFKLGSECPTKLFYSADLSYGNSKADDEFLKALAEGGFQVGALATLAFPEGVYIETLDHLDAWSQTQELLKMDCIVIYEAAIKHDNYFVRVDVLRKNGNEIEIMEVKAKSFDSLEEDSLEKIFFDKSKLKKGIQHIKAKWEPYILDIAFQVHVAELAFPTFKVIPYLCFANKHARAKVDGLNQLFFVKKDEAGRIRTTISPDAKKLEPSISRELLSLVPMRDFVDSVFKFWTYGPRRFSDFATYLSKLHSSGTKEVPSINRKCKKCEFHTNPESPASLKDGRLECWMTVTKCSEQELRTRPLVYDIWKIAEKADPLISLGRYFADEVTEEDIKPKDNSSEERGLSTTERKMLQVEFLQKKRTGAFIDRERLAEQMNSWKFPLHMIDFETSRVAIPFHKGRRSYEQIAFQFSHHTIEENGKISHAGEFIHFERGQFPNFQFVRKLKEQLSQDSGTIFRYHTHENTVLRDIRKQLITSSEDDKAELIAFIESITHHKLPRGKKVENADPGEDGKFWDPGARCMVDLWEMVRYFYYHPKMGGSISIKQVLPAILGASEYLKNRYSKPIYGIGNEVSSKNFPKDWKWIEMDSNGNVTDPYERLEPIPGLDGFTEGSLEEVLEELLIENDEINNGAAAMMAWNKMQFMEMSEAEREQTKMALLKYCELDTFAMVLIYEYWANELGNRKWKKAA